jgi:hypothetical protein
VLAGPGRTLRAVLDRFPALAPVMNRVAGIEDHANHRRSPGTRSAPKPPRGMTVPPMPSDHRTGSTWDLP